ncbi:MAG: formate dehydrogenase subunit delta [Hydrogenophaga sp.]
MDTHNLVGMANRIGQFFESFSDREEALEGIRQHIHKFWEPRMRRELLVCLDTEGAQGLAPLVVDALNAKRAAWV